MPCMSGPDKDPEMEQEKKDFSEQEKLLIESIRQDGILIAKLEMALCSACRVLKRLAYDFGENPLLDLWWHEHKIRDAKKKEEEKEEEKEKGEH